MAIKPADEYLKQNSFRTAVGSDIYISSDQAAGLKSFLTGFNDNYSALKFSTCVQPVVYSLGTIGINVGTPIFPASLGSALLDTGAVSKSNFYPRTTTPTKPWYYPTNNAPWAR